MRFHASIFFYTANFIKQLNERTQSDKTERAYKQKTPLFFFPSQNTIYSNYIIRALIDEFLNYIETC